MSNNEGIQKNIYLVGPMGAGKSSIGKRLAKRLHRVFYDTDHEVMRRTGVNVSWIFEQEGEAGFRKRETEALRDLSQKTQVVIATGGGAVVTAENCQIMKQNGIVIHLKVSLDQQVQRATRKNGLRPMIETDDPVTALRELNAAREGLYESVADRSYLTDADPIYSITEKILRDIG